MAYRFVIALSRSPPRDNSRPGVQAKDIIGGIVLRKKSKYSSSSQVYTDR